MPKAPTVLDYIEVTGVLNLFCYEKIQTIRHYLSFFYSGEEKSKTKIFKAMQTDAILFEIMQFMEKLAGQLEEADLVRNALVHCFGVIEFSFGEAMVNDLHEEVIRFAKYFISLNQEKITSNRFYKKLIQHGKRLRTDRKK